MTPLLLLRLRWFLILIASAFALYIATSFIQPGVHQQPVESGNSLWVWGAALGLIAHLGILWWGLRHNHRRHEEILLPTLGYGNAITVTRGLLVSLLAGFLLLPQPDTLVAWVPAVLYSVASLLDYLDGYVARVTNHTTVLGEVLDMEFDGLGLLIAIGVAIRYGQLPSWYLLLGLGRQLFILGLWLRERRGLPTYELTPSENRRIIAGVQMGFVSVMLWPILSPPLTIVVGILFSLPLIASFGRDWLVVSGKFDPESALYRQRRRHLQRILEEWGPVAARVVLAAICFVFVSEGWPSFELWGPIFEQIQPQAFLLIWQWLLILVPLLAGALLLGVLSRISALLLLPLPFSSLLVQGIDFSGNTFLLTALVWIIQFGGGRLCLWSPEEPLLRRRAGE